MNERESLLNKLVEIENKYKQQASSLSPNEKRVCLINVIRVLDLWSHWVRYGAGDPKREEKLEAADLIERGTNIALSMFYDDSVGLECYPLGTTSRQVERSMSYMISTLGKIQAARSFIDLSYQGVVSIEQKNENHYVFNVIQPFGHEAAGDADWQFMKRELLNYLDIEGELESEYDYNEIKKILRKNVFRWRDNFIGYTTEPVLDDYYDLFGLKCTYYQSGYDAFSPDCIFGPGKFQHYRDAVAGYQAWALKHIDFCHALVEQSTKTNLINILSITKPKQSTVSNTSIYLEHFHLSDEISGAVLEAATLMPENAAYHLEKPTPAKPSFIQVGKDIYLQPVFGILNNPYEFMLRELRRAYKKDYDVAVNSREGVFQEELKTLFYPDYFSHGHTPIVLKDINKKDLTDIDAAIFDEKSGTLALFQLKWQDNFVRSMRERYSRKSNLLKTGNSWVEVVSEWLKDKDDITILKQLKINPTHQDRRISVRLFVLTWGAGRFSGEWHADTRAVWTGWASFCKQFKELCPTHDILEKMWLGLRSWENNHPLLIEQTQPSTLTCGDLRIDFKCN